MRPTLAGYQAFLGGVVQIQQIAIPPSFTGTATLEQGSSILTVVASTGGQLGDGSIVNDVIGAIPLNTPILSQLSGIPPGGVGTYQMAWDATETVSTAENISAVNNWVVASFLIACEIVNDALSRGVYELAVYNLATDRLVNYAADPLNVEYFKNLRKDLNLKVPTLGVVTGGSDQGTSGAWVTPDFVRSMTLFDLQTLKTPWGREYMGLAQSYGPTIWGLT